MKVEYSSNNSGGSWWLTDEDWHKLEDAGWSVSWCRDWHKEEGMRSGLVRDGRFLGALANDAEKEFTTLREAVEEFERITGQDVAEEGCNCCGPPHSLTAYDENGKYVDSISERRVTESRLDWD